MPLDWDTLTLEPLADAVRRTRNGPDAERTIWGFEQALRTARIDPELLSYLTIAAVCLLARSNDTTPREVLDTLFRRAVADDAWRRDYAPLLD